MALERNVRRFLDTLCVGAARSTGCLTVAERRASLERLLAVGGETPQVANVEQREVPGPAGALRLRIYTPLDAGATVLAGLVYFHGGGLVAGSLDTHDGIARSLANSSGCRLVSVDYRLAPEARFPAAVRDACAATAWIAGHASLLGIDAARLGVCGDSAGATLAAVVCQKLAQAGETAIALQFLLCPIMDYRAQTASRREFASGYLLDEDTLDHDLAHYLVPPADPADPCVSPLASPRLKGLPAACIHTAECDPLRDEGEAYAQRLQQAGVRASYRRHAGMIHMFYGLGALIPYAAAAYRSMGEDIRALLN